MHGQNISMVLTEVKINVVSGAFQRCPAICLELSPCAGMLMERQMFWFFEFSCFNLFGLQTAVQEKSNQQLLKADDMRIWLCPLYLLLLYTTLYIY